MILYFAGVLFVIFILVAALPVLQWYLANGNGKEVTEYSFSSELIDSPHNDLNGDISPAGRMATQYRGSVRMAQGRVLTQKDLEVMKAVVYSVPLP